MPLEKEVPAGDYINRWYHTPGSKTLGIVQTLNGEEVYEDFVTYNTPEEAYEAFEKL